MLARPAEFEHVAWMIMRQMSITKIVASHHQIAGLRCQVFFEVNPKVFFVIVVVWAVNADGTNQFLWVIASESQRTKSPIFTAETQSNSRISSRAQRSLR
jgi:hypothetical protein